MGSSEKTLFLIVVYDKETLQQSKTYMSLLRLFQEGKLKDNKQYEIIVWNNGPKNIAPVDNIVSACGKIKISLINCIENMSLSKVYNTVVADSFKSNPHSYLFIFDDDTTVDDKYINKGTECLDNRFCDIVLPKILCGGKVVSPRYYTGKQVINVQSSFIITEHFTSVMSGVGISLNAFVDKRYNLFDEDYRFYGIDKEFFYQCTSDKKIKVCLIPEGLEHGLSRFDNEDCSDKKKFRIKEQMFSDRLFAKKRNGLLSLIFHIKACKSLLRLLKLYVCKKL